MNCLAMFTRLDYVRSYAATLGLDLEEVARRFRAEASEIARQTDLVFPVPVPERGLPAGALILLGLILVGGAYIGWYRLSGEGRLPAETVASVPTRLATLAEQALPGPDGRVPMPVTPPPRRRGPPATTTSSNRVRPPRKILCCNRIRRLRRRRRLR